MSEPYLIDTPVAFSGVQNVRYFYGVKGKTTTPTPVQTVAARMNFLHGIKNPRWRYQVARMQNATTPLGAEEFGWKSKVDGFVHLKRKTPSSSDSFVNEQMVWGSAISPWCVVLGNDVSEDYTAAAESEAKTHALSDIIDAQRSLQAGVILGEGAESVRTVRNLGRKLWNGFWNYRDAVKKRVRSIQAKHRNLKKRNRLLQDTIAGTWLEHSFGLKPIVNDIESVKDYLSRGRHIHAKAFRAVGFSGGTYSVRRNSSVGYVDLYGRHEFKDTVSVLFQGVVVVDNESKRGIARQIGLWPSDFIPTIYELVPYTWALDYFSNIQEIVNAYAYQRAGIRWVSLTKRKFSLGIYVCESVRPSSNAFYIADVTRPYAEGYRKQISRETYEGDFVPDLTFEIPGLSTRWLNLAAVARLKTL